MSKLSVHDTAPSSTTGFGDFLQKCADANSPVGVVYGLNRNIGPDIAAHSPSTRWIYRRQSDAFPRLPEGMFVTDPVASATNWLTGIKDPNDQNRTQIENWKLNPADWFSTLNEPVADTVEKARWLNTWELTALEIANSNGFKLALFSFHTGFSKDPLIWNELLPCLRRGKQLGAIMSLHAYWEGDPSLDTHNALRYRDIYALLPADAQLPIVISEASSGNGYDTGLSGQAWVNDMARYDSELMKDAYVLGACGFQLGGNESNLVSALPSYGDYIAAHPTPITPPPVITPSPSGTLVPPALQIIDKDLAVWSLGGAAVHGSILLKNGGQFGGGQGIFLLYYNDQVYTKNDQGMWFVADAAGWHQIAGDPRVLLRAKGIDVSHWNGAIDWPAVKAGGVSFAFIKSTEGSNIQDSTFARNWTGAKAAGVIRGAYHYYRFAATPQTQAKLFVASLKGDYGELPLVVDVEDTALSASLCPASSIQTFISLVQSATGRKVLIYTGAWYWPSHLAGVTSWAVSQDLWLAGKVIPSPWKAWQFQQYPAAVVKGIPALTDINAFNGTESDLKAYCDKVRIVPPVPVPPPVSTAWRGLHMRADGHSMALDFQALTTAKCNAAKLMTNTGFDELDALKVLVPVKNIVLRLFAAGDNPALGNSAQFFDQQRAWLDYFAKAGGVWVEVHNEANLPQEGYGKFWTSGAGFGAFFAQVSDLIHVNFPTLRVGYPGLSPNTPNEAEFITSLRALISIGKVDWIAAHSYWINAADMNVTDNGRHYRRFLNMGKPVLITEFANVSATDSDQAKGAQYKSYYASLEAGVIGAYAFVSSASDPAFVCQTWIRNGSLTAIAAAVGS